MVLQIIFWSVTDTVAMEATESPLDVLSRAATMVQDSSPPDYGELYLSYLFTESGCCCCWSWWCLTLISVLSFTL